MDDELVFRSLLQATAIGSFFTSRYLLDVLFTPRAVNALSHQILALLHCICRAAWTAPVASLLLLYFWGSLQPSTVVIWVLKGCILRAVLVALLTGPRRQRKLLEKVENCLRKKENLEL